MLNADASDAGNHTHTVTGSGTVTVPTISATSNKKLSVTVTKDIDFLTGVTPVVSKLSTVSIVPAKSNGTVTPASAKAVTAASIVDTGSTGIAFVSDITIGSADTTVSVSGNTSEAGTHTHDVTIS